MNRKELVENINEEIDCFEKYVEDEQYGLLDKVSRFTELLETIGSYIKTYIIKSKK